MAMNPMQRKIRNSFLFGFLIAIIVGAVVIGLLFMKIKSLNSTITDLQEKQKVATKTVYALSGDAKQDQTLAGDENGNGALLTPINMPTQLVPTSALTDQKLNDFRNDDGALEITAKIDLQKGTILTTDMVQNEKNAGTFRQIEYTMISLPSKLAEGDFIDVRIKFPTGENFVVISKIKVDATTTNSVWLTLSEGQLLLLNNAIVESYIIDGTSLYATKFANEAQPELAQTYSPNPNVSELIRSSSSAELDKKIIADRSDINARAVINDLLELYETDEQTDKVQEGFTTEETTIQAAREELLGDMGY